MANSCFRASTVFQLLTELCFSTTIVLSWKGSSDVDILYSELYPTFKTLESALVQDQKQLHSLRQAFFPMVVNRFWSVDDVDVVIIQACLYFSSSNNSSADEAEFDSQLNGIQKCWDFQWTNSQLMSITSADVLLAMEPVYFIVFYSDVVGSLRNSRGTDLNFCVPLAELPCNTCKPSDHELIQSLGMLLSWAKAYAIANGIPSQWETQYQGYVTRWYTYTANEPLYDKITDIDKLYYITLWVTFTIVNILIPFVLYRRGVQLTEVVSNFSRRICQVCPAIFQASAGIIILFNTVYLVLMIGLHVHGGQPSILGCILSTTRYWCRIPATENFNTIIIGVLMTKIALFASGVLIELVAAMKITNQLYRSFWASGKYNCVRVVAMCFTIWHCLMFIHIVFGLVSIPFVLGFIISPMQTILVMGLISGTIVCLTIALASVIHAKLWNLKLCKANICTLLENLLILGLLIAVFTTYFMVVKGGVNMTTMKGILLTLLPTLPLPVLTWMAKKKLYDAEGIRTKPSPITDSTMQLSKLEKMS